MPPESNASTQVQPEAAKPASFWSRKIVWVILFVVLIPLTIGAYFYSDTIYYLLKPVPHATFVTQPIASDAVPLLWLDEKNLLIGSDYKIVNFDTKSKQVTSVVSDLYYPGGYECFSPFGAIFPTSDPQAPILSADAHRDSRRVADWRVPNKYQTQDILEWWNTNPLDCTFYDYEKDQIKVKTIGTKRSSEAGRSYSPEPETDPGPKLLRSADGDAFVYYTGGTSDRHRTALTLLPGGEINEVDLGSGFDWSNKVQSAYDQTQQKYFWYNDTNQFDVESGIWPLVGAWVDVHGTLLGKVSIPAGPWVLPRSSFYGISECGYECYTHMKIYVGNNDLFIRIFGESIPTPVKGVYKLDRSKNKWVKIIDGELNNELVISPSACQLAYSLVGELNVMNVCQPLPEK